MIQDIFPHQLKNSFVPGKISGPDSPVLVFEKGELLVKDDPEQVCFPKKKEFGESLKEDALQFLFTMDETDLFLARQEKITPPNGYAYRPVRSLRTASEAYGVWIFAAYTAWQLANWYKDNRYCGTCGTKTVPAPDERAIDCPCCGRRIYPRIIPAVIVGVTNQDKLLITRYADRPLAVDALVAGFTEIGETLEQTVEREVMEEVGLRVKNIRYYKSQPWGIVDDILAGFYCDVDGDDEIHRDTKELKVAHWVQREQITGQPDNFSLTNEMMMTFKAGKEPKA